MIGQNRDIPLNKLMEYPLGPLPLAIATHEGLPVKTVKATLLKLLETGVEYISDKDAVWIYDGMAIIPHCCSHEEADTRILFHAGADTVVINSQDTEQQL